MNVIACVTRATGSTSSLKLTQRPVRESWVTRVSRRDSARVTLVRRGDVFVPCGLAVPVTGEFLRMQGTYDVEFRRSRADHEEKTSQISELDYDNGELYHRKELIAKALQL